MVKYILEPVNWVSFCMQGKKSIVFSSKLELKKAHMNALMGTFVALCIAGVTPFTII